MKTVVEHKWIVFSMHQRNWNETLLLLLLAYKESTIEITSKTHVSMVFGKELLVPSDAWHQAVRLLTS
jgi:hypothetical protein